MKTPQFNKTVKKILKEQDLSEEEEWEKSLDKDTDPSEFDVPDNPSITYSDEASKKIRRWIDKIEEFADWINGIDEDSLHSKISKLDYEDGPLNGVLNKQKNHLVEIAKDLNGLSEMLKAQIIDNERKDEEPAKSNQR